ncbi:hypothetical protein M8044_000062 [Columbia Basin potato purple top phytoplasma]|uniref:Uncharacterized protein n=1 Tax=Columbia Basin potato purple top phytoplasma TaxID=307134 RepID=A0ABT5L834_9MOLU|nr:hypothetical protein [Columbia Basin potato purple top phytoplasma]
MLKNFKIVFFIILKYFLLFINFYFNNVVF